MNSFNQSRKVETESLAILLPFLEERFERLVFTGKGRLAKRLQETVGDVLTNDQAGRIWSIELKAERQHTGNLFLETWSNRNLSNRQDWFDHGSNVGWLYKMCCDLFFYHFLDADRLYVIDVFSLKRWAFSASSNRPDLTGRLFDFRERPQGKYQQLNDTHGRLVPVQVLFKELPPGRIKCVNPLQLSMSLGDDLSTSGQGELL